MKDFLELVRQSLRPDLLDTDPAALEAYGRDWTRHYEPRPLAIAFPKTTDEVSRLLKLASEHRIAVVPSGGRTGLSAGAVAAKGELVLSLAKMNRIHDVDPVSRIVRVQAGAVTEAVHEKAAEHGLTWPIDFASKGSSTVGGNIATNAGGVKVVRYGLTREWVLGLQVVLMDGTVMELNGELIKNNTGYDLRQLFIGSEGTLGIITEASLKLTDLPRELQVYFFALPDFASVLRLFESAQKAPARLMAFETLTDACLKNVLAHRALPAPFGEPHPVYALVEFENPRAEMDDWLGSLFEQGLVLDGTRAENSEQFKTLWAYREGVSESLSARGFVHKNDVALPVARIEPFIAEFMALFERQYQGLEVFVFGHIGDGNLHLNILKPDALDKAAFLTRCQEVDRELFALIQKHHGSISAEHGIGLTKKWALGYSRTPIEIELFRRIKRAFDPEGLLNPGKIFD